MTPILLDTCAAIWIGEGAPIAQVAMDALGDAFNGGVPLLVSPFTAWEVGQLVSRGRLALTKPPLEWFESLIALPGIKAAPLGPRHFVQSSFLPGEPPRDPADRIMAATARLEGYRLMTRDRLLLAYGEAGHMQTLAC